MCVCICIIPILIYLSIFLSIFQVSCKEIKWIPFYSSFMLTWYSWSPVYEFWKRTGRFSDLHWTLYLCSLRISMEHFCIITSSNYLIFLKKILKNRLLDNSPLKKIKQIQTIIFVFCPDVTAIYGTIWHTASSK